MTALLKDEITVIEDYVPYFHTMRYMDRKYHECLLSDEQLKRASGYANIEQFRRHRADWHRCEGSIPKNYMNVLGVDFHVLEFTLELDQQLFDRAIQMPVDVISYGIRLEDQTVMTRPFAKGMDYERAVGFLVNISRQNTFRYFINIPGLRYIEISRQEGIREVLYRPAIYVTGISVEFGNQGLGILFTSD